MVSKKNEIECQLDELTQSMHKEDIELYNSADMLEASKGEKHLKKVELMSEIYEKNHKIPTWPINISIFSKFLASQTVPILSFLGVSEPIVSVVKNLLQNGSR